VSPVCPISRSHSGSGITPVDAPARLERRVGERAHEADACAAVDERVPAPREQRAERARGVDVPGVGRRRASRRRRRGWRPSSDGACTRRTRRARAAARPRGRTAFFGRVSALHVVPPARPPVAPAAAPSRAWLRSATLAAAATVGALVGFGIADGASLSRLAVVSLRLRGLPEFVTPDRRALAAAAVGGAYAALTGAAWGAALGAGAERLARRGVRAPRLAAALAAAALVAALADGWLPLPLRLAAGALAPAERALTALLLAATAWAWGARRRGAARADALPG
jgi:hypothetical protein